jgi:alpha-tubulin suppressor-like RCC1 family protein
MKFISNSKIKFFGLLSAGLLIFPLKYKFDQNKVKLNSKGGTVYAWGNGIYGQLGIGQETISQPVPMIINELSSANYQIEKLIASADISAVITTKKELLIWGKAKDGALGAFPGGTVNIVKPALFIYLDKIDSNVLDADFGKEHGALVTKNGSLYTWGVDMYNKLGHLEDSSAFTEKTRRRVPKSAYENVRFSQVVIQGEKKVISVRCGYNHTTCLTSEGEVYSWGLGKEGALGHSNFDNIKTPNKIEYFSQNNIKITKIDCGDNFTMAVSDSGRIFSWGKNNLGQLGLGQVSQQLKISTPTEISFHGEKIKDIFCGEDHSCVITANGDAYLWGYGIDGRLGNKNKMNMNTPTKISIDNSKIKKVSCGGQHTAILTEDGNLYMCGNGRNGELGRGDVLESTSVVRDEPLLVNHFKIKGEKIIDVACGSSHTIALAE